MNHIESSQFVCCKQSEIYGRYLEAKTTIKKGALIFTEKVLVAGPMRSSDFVCVGCHKEIDLGIVKRCTKCSWPVCSAECSESVYHKPECHFFTGHQFQAPNFDELSFTPGEFGALAVLRALLLKVTNPKEWELLNTLEHHNEIRRKLPLWNENELMVVQVIRDKWKLGHLFSAEEIHSVCGILEVNSFELGETYSYRGIFPSAAILAHSCVPNTTHFINNAEGTIDIRAAVAIPGGTPLFLTYAVSLQGTTLRQKSLMDIKFFECGCERCKDPTELGTHLSTLKCQKCKTGLVLKDKCGSSWKCNELKCGKSITDTVVENLVDKFFDAWEHLDGISSQEKFLEECQKFFHANHFIPLRVKFDLCQAYGREGVGNIHELTDEDLARKHNLCSDVLHVLDIITPGYTVTRGLILYEFQATQLVTARRVFENGDFVPTDLRKKLLAAMKILLETISILVLSPVGTVEHDLAQGAKKETLVGLQCWIDCLK